MVVIQKVVKGGFRSRFMRGKTVISHFTGKKISNFTKFNELVFNCVNLMPFLTRQPIFTL